MNKDIGRRSVWGLSYLKKLVFAQDMEPATFKLNNECNESFQPVWLKRFRL